MNFAFQKVFGALVLGLVFLSQTQCQSEKPRNTFRSSESPDAPSRPLVEDKYRLTEDRQKLDELRKEIPPDQKTENDELALVLQLLKDESKPPYEIKNKFDQVLRKKRELFQRDAQRERESWTTSERKKREAFLKRMDQDRKDFQSQKVSKDQRAEFYKSQDMARREFSANERDRRADFESDFRERRKSFEDYARENQNSFYQEWRAYSKRFDDQKRKKEDNNFGEPSGANGEVKSFLQELEDSKRMKSEKIESGQ